MLIIKLITIVALVTLTVCFSGLLLKNYYTYSNCIEVLEYKDFKLKRFLPVGLYILDKYRYSFNSNYDRRFLTNICEIYGQEYSAFYIRMFYSKKIVLALLLMVFELLAGITFNYQMEVHVYVFLFFGVFIIIDDIKLGNRVKMRRLGIQLEFPDFINKLTLLLNAGLTMSKAWEKISEDCNKEGDLYTEIRRTVLEIKSGKNESEAYSEFAKRVKTPEISRLMSTIVQNTKRGGNQLVLSLRIQSNECWEMRKNAIKRLGEEASTKLLFPMMIMFFAIIIIVVTPAIISMQGI
jgi:tight adherence protein C